MFNVFRDGIMCYWWTKQKAVVFFLRHRNRRSSLTVRSYELLLANLSCAVDSQIFCRSCAKVFFHCWIRRCFSTDLSSKTKQNRAARPLTFDVRAFLRPRNISRSLSRLSFFSSSGNVRADIPGIVINGRLFVIYSSDGRDAHIEKDVFSPQPKAI